MARQILIALRNQDRLAEFVPYIEEIAQPEMKVVLLIPFAPNRDSSASSDGWVTRRPFEEAMFVRDLAASKLADLETRTARSLAQQKLLAEQKIVFAEERLRKRGVEIVADVYTESLRGVVRRYTRDGNVHLIMKRPGWVDKLGQFLRRTFSVSSSFTQPTLSPVLLLFRPSPAIQG